VGSRLRYRVKIAVLLAALASPALAQVSCDLAAADARAAGAGCAKAWFDANLRLNEIQTVGTAESYKQRPSPAMLKLIGMGGGDDVKALDYGEPSIADQLTAGARSLTFDIAYDPKGGLYKYPAGASMAGDLVPDDYVAAMATPGFKVIHIFDIDFTGSCVTLDACLQAVATWSRAHPDHVPIVIALKSNDERTPMPGATKPAKFDAAAFDALDESIRAVFKPEEIITPDSIQGSAANLRDALKANGWPKLGPSRGKVLFVLDDTPAKVALYRGARASLEGRVMFVATDAASPAAGFVAVENPATDSAAVIAAVKGGLIVRTFADADTKEARANNTLRSDWAFAAGAQVIATDFLEPDPRIGKYRVRSPDRHYTRCNVQLNAQRCMGFGVETGVPPAGTAPARPREVLIPRP
jgi:Phosphoinositide phospholipase C, Ca2+-dependent